MIKFVCVGLEKEEKRGEGSKGTWEKRKDWGECAAFEMRFAFLLWEKGERDDFFSFAQSSIGQCGNRGTDLERHCEL